MIDKPTIEKIKDAANIVDVVSEFVSLRKRGANYMGLCPFHNEKTPSFVVSPSRGTCHCFGCGKGGNAVSFIMEHEQMTYPEALKWLANKYHIEIKERELTDDEKSERESMFIVNEWTAKYFQNILHNTPDGLDIGMQYFRSRGFRDDIIEKFQLGYDLQDRHALAATAIKKGYKPEFLLKTGICYENDRHELIDRFSGRVVFPWIGVSGKVVGFGGRVLDSRTKGVNVKYVNSPESDIYHKDHELYGIYQAKKAIAKEDRVYMVEGYTDVISMHQCGIENVVANSGTALSFHQIHTLHRFTSNITLLYDGDEAGIHAALRGTDMLLAEGMNLKVLLLPDGNDPDSFSRQHSAAVFRQYINDHQTDFIQFKTDLLLNKEVTDASKQSEAIASIVKSISFISDHVLRTKYLHECSIKQNIPEITLINTMNEFIRNAKKQQTTEDQRRQEQALVANLEDSITSATPMQQAKKVEQMLIQLVMKYGERIIVKDATDEEGNVYTLSVAQFIDYNLNTDNLQFGNELYNKILAEAVECCRTEGFRAETYFIHHEDIEVSRLAIDMTADKFKLSESLKKEVDDERLLNRTIHLLLDFRMDYVEKRLKELQQGISLAVNEPEKMLKLMEEYKDMQNIRNTLARKLGNNIIV